MKNILLALLLVLVPATAFAEELRIGTECTYAPFTYRDAEGNIKGFDVDIATEVARRIGRDPVFICNPFDTSIPSLQARKFDILFSALSVNAEREKVVNFSLPYRASTARFAGPVSFSAEPFDADGNPNPDALKGYAIGVQRSSNYANFIADFFPGVDVRLYDTVNNMILDLKAGRLDLIMTGPINLWSNLLSVEGGDQFKFVGPEIDNIDYFGIGIAAAMRKDDPQLLEQVNAAIQAMYEDGSFKEINLRYWDFTVMPTVWQ